MGLSTMDAATHSKAAESVLASRDLFACIVSYQTGILPTLQGIYLSRGLWFSTFSPHDFYPMHTGPFGRKREALLQCIVWDRCDLVRDFFRCFPTYAHDDARFKEVIDAALMLNRIDISLLLRQYKPTYHCSSRVLLKAAMRGHKLDRTLLPMDIPAQHVLVKP
ncbi:hypothetical protein ACHHYP_20351 [Achlya hypogyna]|uniref:Uncharacterized protein n=1 Tax=Achlya hypogyna TaxID=1202772 RepID=A0A1V9YPX5_ACHHY|nr:hypothetical protein ACHHYP_20351 [Achlya hypogyna]